MSTISSTSNASGMPSGVSAQRLARTAGFLFLLSLFVGGLGEFYAPGHIVVSGDALATANNVRNMDLLLRLGFAGYLIEATCDIALAWVFYLLLRPVNRNLALLTAFFGLVSTATFACFELFYFAPTFILGASGYLKAFTPEQLDALAMISFRLYGYGASLFMVFYGTGWVLRGNLMYHSGYLPKALGALMTLAGTGFMVNNFAVLLLPGFRSVLFVLPMFLGGVALTTWLFVKGVDVTKWNERVGALSV